MTRFEHWVRDWLNRRWRRLSSAQEITEATWRMACDAERERLAAVQNDIITGLAFLARAEREDGWERAELVATHQPKDTP